MHHIKKMVDGGITRQHNGQFVNTNSETSSYQSHSLDTGNWKSNSTQEASPPYLISTSCDRDLSPPHCQTYRFLPLPQGRLVPNCSKNRFIRFQCILFISLVTDEWTDDQAQTKCLFNFHTT